MNWISLLTNKWIIGASAILIVAATVYVQHITIFNLQTQLMQSKANLEQEKIVSQVEIRQNEIQSHRPDDSSALIGILQHDEY